MRIIIAIVLVSLGVISEVRALESGYYLKWDSDHTRRQIRPVYPIDETDIGKFKLYKVTVESGKPASVCYLAFAQPSDASNFGAYCVRFDYDHQGIIRTFYNTEGRQVVNAQGVYQEEYVTSGHAYPLSKRHLDVNGELIEDKLGVAEYRYKRDQLGRRISELRLNIKGEVVPEHNGFYEARFAFDANDYASYRKGFDKHGQIMQGPKGYATAYFWFDNNGTFLKEEFRDAQEKLVLGPTGDYARIEYHDIDDYGNWHKVYFFDEYGKPLTQSAAMGVADYYDFKQRKSIAFYNVSMSPAANAKGVARYLYVYDSNNDFVRREAYKLTGQRILE